jgi:hypothetical protein
LSVELFHATRTAVSELSFWANPVGTDGGAVSAVDAGALLTVESLLREGSLLQVGSLATSATSAVSPREEWRW